MTLQSFRQTGIYDIIATLFAKFSPNIYIKGGRQQTPYYQQQECSLCERNHQQHMNT